MEEEKGKKQTKTVKSPERKSSKKLPVSEAIETFNAITLSEPNKNTELIKLELEKEKIALERDKLFVSSLIEDFKARWQELLNFENENSRWQTLYVTALILVISWVLSNSGEGEKYRNISDIFIGDNSYLLLALALINAVYTLAMAYKGYQIQEIAQYLYTNIGEKISEKTLIEFNSWERWRRDETGSPVYIRTIFYIIIGILPTAVSTTILGLYFYHRYNSEQALHPINIFFYFVSLFVFMSLITALSTTRMNSKWEEILNRQTVFPKVGNKDAGS